MFLFSQSINEEAFLQDANTQNEQLFTIIADIAYWEFCWFELAVITTSLKIELVHTTTARVQ